MSSPEDLLTACATSQEERQRLISRANDALSLWDNWLHPFTSGSETGDDPAYDDNFQLMREEINKLGYRYSCCASWPRSVFANAPKIFVL
jgi:type VI secretion system protein VasJ